jgi:septal ring factor EnvC (AmiA/AmiB activator)
VKRRAAFYLLLLALAAAGAAPAETPNPAALTPEQRAEEELKARTRLEELRTEMRALEAERAAARGEQREAESGLREIEQAVAASARELRRLDEELGARAQALAALEREAKVLGARLGAERETLATLLRSAYAEGQYAPLMPILAPDTLEDSVRVLGYHRVLNTVRAERIRAVQADLERSRTLAQELEQARTALAQTRDERAAESLQLDERRARHRELIAALIQKQGEQGAALKTLAANERELLALLERLKDVLADIPKVLSGSEPFAERKGRLAWPVGGTVQAPYGSALSDGRKRQGLLIQAKTGSEVHAVGHGRVAYADWLRGYGQIAIVDHGDGFLSLYAHCEALLREVGDWVQEGEAIATAGSPGVDHGAGLYFELRKNGQALDPGPWLASSAGTKSVNK